MRAIAFATIPAAFMIAAAPTASAGPVAVVVAEIGKRVVQGGLGYAGIKTLEYICLERTRAGCVFELKMNSLILRFKSSSGR